MRYNGDGYKYVVRCGSYGRRWYWNILCSLQFLMMKFSNIKKCMDRLQLLSDSFECFLRSHQWKDYISSSFALWFPDPVPLRSAQILAQSLCRYIMGYEVTISFLQITPVLIINSSPRLSVACRLMLVISHFILAVVFELCRSHRILAFKR